MTDPEPVCVQSIHYYGDDIPTGRHLGCIFTAKTLDETQRKADSQTMAYEPVDLGHPDANREVNFIRAVLDETPVAWWYLSFVDPDLSPPLDEQVPGGRSWLGACYVKASNEIMAVSEAHRLGCNPGGEVAILGPITDEQMDENTPVDDRNRLLSREDIDDA